MHEYSVMSSLITALLEELEDRKIKKVKTVTLEIGALTFLGEQQMKFAYEALSIDTMLEGSELEVKELPAEIKCPECGYEGEVNYADDPAFHLRIPVISCPECGGKPEITQGKETVIKNITVMEEEDES